MSRPIGKPPPKPARFDCVDGAAGLYLKWRGFGRHGGRLPPVPCNRQPMTTVKVLKTIDGDRGSVRHSGQSGGYSPRYGRTYCSAMSQGKKIQVSWLTSVT